MNQKERMFWHYVFFIAALCGALGVIISLVRWGYVIEPCCS